MDYLDPKKQREHIIRLMVGYVLVSITIFVGAVLLLYQAYGFGLDKNGQVIQNGLVFVSSQPHPAKIYLDGKLNKSRTNTRLFLPSGDYTLKLQRDGYREWQRKISVQGGDVQHFDYPFLFPTELTSSVVAPLAGTPAIATQSPDRRWLVVQPSATEPVFDVYDLKNPAKQPLRVALPDSKVSKASGSQSWQALEWANDNQRVLLKHVFDGKTEFIVLDRITADQAHNLNNELSVTPTLITLNDKKYDQYYLFNTADNTLQKASLSNPAPTPYLDHVLAYKSYSDDTVLFSTDANVTAGKVAIRMEVGTKQYLLREVSPGSSYVLDLAAYSGDLYAVVGSVADDRVYIYKNPVNQLTSQPKQTAIPLRVMRIKAADSESFSTNTQFIMAESSSTVAMYDIENNKAYYYTLRDPLDPPQTHVNWMDGDRLAYVSQGKLVVIDYDNLNRQVLVAASPLYSPAFTPDFKNLLVLAPAPTQFELTETSLLTPADR